MAQRIHHQQCLICKSTRLSLAFPVKDHSISSETFDLWDCQDCGFRFTQDIPDADSIGPYYQSEDYISHSDTKKGIINQLYHTARSWMLQRKYQLVKRYSSTNRVLDVGSGTGYFLSFLKEKGHEVLGVEADPGARAATKDQFGIEVHPPTLVEEGQLPGPFGAITMWHVMEHVHEPDVYLKSFNKSLDEEGTLIIAVPNRDALDAEKYGPVWAAYDVPRHLWHFRPKDIEALVKRNGFEVVEKIKMVLDPFYVSMLSEKYLGKGASGLISAAIVGLRSHLNSLKNVNEASSVIYVMKKVK